MILPIKKVDNHPGKPYYILWDSIDLIHGERNIIGDTREEVIEKFKKTKKEDLSPKYKKYA